MEAVYHPPSCLTIPKDTNNQDSSPTHSRSPQSHISSSESSSDDSDASPHDTNVRTI